MMVIMIMTDYDDGNYTEQKDEYTSTSMDLQKLWETIERKKNAQMQENVSD